MFNRIRKQRVNCVAVAFTANIKFTLLKWKVHKINSSELQCTRELYRDIQERLWHYCFQSGFFYFLFSIYFFAGCRCWYFSMCKFRNNDLVKLQSYFWLIHIINIAKYTSKSSQREFKSHGLVFGRDATLSTTILTYY